MKVVIPEGVRSRLGGRHCELSGCGLPTREGKPYCSDHVEHNPYAKEVMEKLGQREDDDERAGAKTARRKKLNTSGVTATELLHAVAERGPRTVERLCRELNIEMDVLNGYVSALSREGRISLGQTSRGSVVVSLAG